MTSETFVAEAVAAIVEDRRTPVPSGERWEAYRRADDALAPLAWQLAEMTEHQILPVAEYLAGVLDREPLRSRPTFEPHRIVLGLFLLALRDVVTGLEADEEVARRLGVELRPAWYAAAIESVLATEQPHASPEDPPMPEPPAAPTSDEIAEFFA
jgi:hypothetical protein